MPELLAPAGGPEPFRAAIAAGADAVYCGFGSDFNARRGAANFSADEFSEACRQAHLAGARVYVTVNVAVRDDELPSALAHVRHAAELGADAFIIQDWGLLAQVRRSWPELECHVSTQANVHDARGVAWCRDAFGAARVTLSRELSLPEIARIAEEGVDLEVFAHGALCFCYSGVCLLSSMEGGRSANRGLCAQPCRLPYDLVDEAGGVISARGRTRPLCPKDNNVIRDLAPLVASGVASLKVEGRMKAPDYVFTVVGAYREAIDGLAAGGRPGDDEAARDRRLKRAFNRDFTDAYLHGRSGDEMMSYERSNNRGELAGVVVGCPGRTARVRLDAPVGAGDLLELRPDDDPNAFLTTHAEADAPAGEIISCPVKRPMPVGCPVRVIRSARLMAAASAAVLREVPRRRPVRVRVEARLGSPLAISMETCDGRARAEAVGAVVEAARTKAVSAEELAEHVGRMGSTPFEVEGGTAAIEVCLDEGCGMGFSSVHRLRAACCDALGRAILEPYESRAASLAPVPASVATGRAGEPSAPMGEPEVCALVRSAETAVAALEAGATRLYATSDDLAVGEWPHDVVPVLDEVCREGDHGRLDAWVRQGRPVACGNVSELALAAERGALAELRGCVPVHNRACLDALAERGARAAWLSPELTLDEVALLARDAPILLGIVVSGRPRVMTSEHCVLQAAGSCVHDCARCELRGRRLSLRDRDGSLLPVRTDAHGRSRIYDAHPLDATPEVGRLLACGVTRLMVDATLLDEGEARFAVGRLVRAVAVARKGGRPAKRLSGATSGHLFWAIG
jgi:putative protease